MTAILLLALLAGRVLATSDVPDPARTPGATNPAVTQATIHTTICVSGWTKTIRPPAAETNALKRSQMTTWHLPGVMKDYEEDHLISLELGGDPGFVKRGKTWTATSTANLWPEPWVGQWNAHVKDHLENRLKALVCHGDVTLAVAQRAIAEDWIAAFQQYVTRPSPRVKVGE